MKEKLAKIRRTMARNKPIYKELKVADLCIADYQRGDLSMSKVKKYAENFDWDIFETPLVSYRDGTYWIVDGQHRIEVLKLLGVETVMCKVLVGLTYEEESSKFNKLNSERRLLSANDKFHSRVEAKEPDAVTIRDILSNNNLTYSKRLCRKGMDKITAITVVENIYHDGGKKHLDRVLHILKEAWCGEPSAFGCDMMQGLSTFLRHSRGINDEILVSCFEKRMPKDIVIAANVCASRDGVCVSTSGGTKKSHVAKIMRDLYSAEKKRLELRLMLDN